jgi:hypothetical protein
MTLPTVPGKSFNRSGVRLLCTQLLCNQLTKPDLDLFSPKQFIGLALAMLGRQQNFVPTIRRPADPIIR